MNQSHKYCYFSSLLMLFSLVLSGCGESSSSGGKVNFSLASQSSSSAATASLRGGYSSAATADTEITCVEESIGGETSYKCSLTPLDYIFGLKQIFLIDEDGVKISVFESDSFEQISLSTNEVAASVDLSGLSDGTYTQVQIVLAYLEQTFQDEDYVADDLKGRSYRICTGLNPTGSLECGNEGAEIGDYLMQPESESDDMQFIIFDGCAEDGDSNVSCGSWDVTDTRPTDYSSNDEHFADFFDNEDEDVGGYWSPIINFSEAVELTSTSTINVSFDLSNMFQWRPSGMEKAELDSSDQPLFNGFLSGDGVTEDDQYDILTDWAFLPSIPVTTVTVE